MCGIIGFVSPQTYKEEIILNMTSKLESRGPDDYGIWKNETFGIYLGHRRLSILDLSKEGKQPMKSFDGKYIIIFNGEIYNHLSLRGKDRSIPQNQLER